MLSWIRSCNWEFGFIDSSTSVSTALIEFYNFLCVLLILISFLIGYWMLFILKNNVFLKNYPININTKEFVLKNNTNLRYFFNINLLDRVFSFMTIFDVKDAHLVEGLWSIVPLSFVSTVAYPSIGLEYGISPDITPTVTVKVIAHQWYWVVDIITVVSPGLSECEDEFIFLESDLYKLFINTYGNPSAFFEGLEHLGYKTLRKSIDINLKNEDPNFFRLLAIDNKVILPVNVPIEFIITSIDVLHSFALPALAMKIDAVPGRLSQQTIIIERPGLYWGQCSELCGPYHGFMPLIIEATTYDVFIKEMSL